MVKQPKYGQILLKSEKR